MNKFLKYLLLAMMVKTSGALAQDQLHNPFAKTKKIQEQLQQLPLSAIEPNGWLRQQLQQNMSGFTGNLDSLVTDLIIEDSVGVACRAFLQDSHRSRMRRCPRMTLIDVPSMFGSTPRSIRRGKLATALLV